MCDDDRRGEAAVRHPARRVVIVGNAFARELQRAAFGRAGIADAQDVVAAPIEREAREAKFREHGRQPTRCTDVEVHRVAVEQEHAAADRSLLRHVERAVERRRVGHDRDQFGAHRGASWNS